MTVHQNQPNSIFLRTGLPDIFIAFILVNFSSSVLACSCGSFDHSVTKEYKNSDWVFLGHVLGFDKKFKHPDYYPEFEILRMWKGPTVNYVSLLPDLVNGNISNCSLKFKKNETYLIYTYKTKKGYATNMCQRVRTEKYSEMETIILDALNGIVSWDFAVERVLENFQNSKDDLTRKLAVDALIEFPRKVLPDKTLSILRQGFKDTDHEVRKSTLSVFRSLYSGNKDIVEQILTVQNDRSSKVRFYLAIELSSLASKFPDKRKEIMKSFVKILSKESQLLFDENEKEKQSYSKRVMNIALRNLAKHGNEQQMQLVIPYNLKGIKSQRESEQRSAIDYISIINSPVPELIPIMKQYMDPNRQESLDNYKAREELERVV